MSFFDPQMTHESLPDGWFDYDLHVEVPTTNIRLIKHLENTNWIYFANGGYITGNVKYKEIIDSSTRWYGLNENMIK